MMILKGSGNAIPAKQTYRKERFRDIEISRGGSRIVSGDNKRQENRHKMPG